MDTSEVDEQTQAEMAIRLSDSVRDLVREHLADALNDTDWLLSHMGPNTQMDLLRSMLNNTPSTWISGDYTFKDAVLRVVEQHLAVKVSRF